MPLFYSNKHNKRLTCHFKVQSESPTSHRRPNKVCCFNTMQGFRRKTFRRWVLSMINLLSLLWTSRICCQIFMLFLVSIMQTIDTDPNTDFFYLIQWNNIHRRSKFYVDIHPLCELTHLVKIVHAYRLQLLRYNYFYFIALPVHLFGDNCPFVIHIVCGLRPLLLLQYTLSIMFFLYCDRLINVASPNGRPSYQT